MDNKIMKDEVEKEINGLSYDLNEYLINNKEAKIKLQRLLDLTDKSEKIVFRKGFLSKEKDVLKILDEWFIDNQPTKGSDYLDNELFILATESKLEELKNRINQNDKHR